MLRPFRPPICTKSCAAFAEFAAFFAYYELILVRQTRSDNDDDIDDLSPQSLSFPRHLRHKIDATLLY